MAANTSVFWMPFRVWTTLPFSWISSGSPRLVHALSATSRIFSKLCAMSSVDTDLDALSP